MDVFQKLKAEGARLVTITAVDEKNLIYHFIADGKAESVKVNLKGNTANSLTGVFPNAVLYEREIFEMFGIKFKGHPKLEGLFLSKEVKRPLRKSG